jgi:hypothetical protein
MGKMILIVGASLGSTYAQVIAANQNDLELIKMMEAVPKEFIEDQNFIIKRFPEIDHIILTPLKNLNNEKINSLPYHRRFGRSDFHSKQLRTKPYRTQKNRYTRKKR